jgi:hypothetical protein
MSCLSLLFSLSPFSSRSSAHPCLFQTRPSPFLLLERVLLFPRSVGISILRLCPSCPLACSYPFCLLGCSFLSPAASDVGLPRHLLFPLNRLSFCPCTRRAHSPDLPPDLLVLCCGRAHWSYNYLSESEICRHLTTCPEACRR